MNKTKLKALPRQRFEKMSRLRFLVRCRYSLTSKELIEIRELTGEVLANNPVWYNANEFTKDEAKNFLDLVERCVKGRKFTEHFSLEVGKKILQELRMKVMVL